MGLPGSGLPTPDPWSGALERMVRRLSKLPAPVGEVAMRESSHSLLLLLSSSSLAALSLPREPVNFLARPSRFLPKCCSLPVLLIPLP